MQKKRFTQARGELMRRRTRIVETIQGIEKDEAPFVGSCEIDPLDAAADRTAVSTDDSLNAREAVELRQIDAALARLDADVWGSCASCGDPIEPRRLEALPEAELCLACVEVQAAQIEGTRPQKSSH